MSQNRLIVSVCFENNSLSMNIKNEKDMNMLVEFIEEMNLKRKTVIEGKVLPKVPGLD